MIEELEKLLRAVNEGIEYAEAKDVTYTRHYTMLCKQKSILKRTIRAIEKTQRRAKDV